MSSLRKVHRTIAPVVGILIGLYCVTSLVYRSVRDFYGLNNDDTHFLLDIHDGMIYGSVGVSLSYIVFSWGVIGVQVITGSTMIERVLGYRIRSPPSSQPLLKKGGWSRRIHHFIAPLGGLVFLYKMFTAGTYHLLTEGFRIPSSQVHFLLDLHDARIPGAPWFPTLWVFLVGAISILTLGSGLTILKKKRKS